jgi:hypothetical protein
MGITSAAKETRVALDVHNGSAAPSGSATVVPASRQDCPTSGRLKTLPPSRRGGGEDPPEHVAPKIEIDKTSHPARLRTRIA